MAKPRKEKARHSAGERTDLRGAIYARVIDAENGMRVISGVRAIRVRSRGYNLLIMEDYLPALGKLEGDVTFLTDDGEELMEGVTGFYKHQHNEFTLLVEGRSGREEESGEVVS